MADFMMLTIYLVLAIMVVIAIANTVWKNIGCIFIGGCLLMVSLILFKALGMHF